MKYVSQYRERFFTYSIQKHALALVGIVLRAIVKSRQKLRERKPLARISYAGSIYVPDSFVNTTHVYFSVHFDYLLSAYLNIFVSDCIKKRQLDSKSVNMYVQQQYRPAHCVSVCLSVSLSDRRVKMKTTGHQLMHACVRAATNSYIIQYQFVVG